MTAHQWKVLYDKKEKPESTAAIIDILLKNRGIKTEKEKESFLNPKLSNVTIDAVGIDEKGVEKTLERIKKAIKNKEKIIIYGDYDVDGICGTAILWETLFAFYKNVMPYIPHRVDEGYGLSVKGIENIMTLYPDVGLIITVDNGIVARDAVAFANEKNIDVVVTDHHVPGEKLPDALAFVHTVKLCGTGVAYLLSKEIILNCHPERSAPAQRALARREGSKNDPMKKRDSSALPQNDNFLELVALATVADLVPLTESNRILLKFGLQSLRKTKRPGLLALFQEAKIKKDEIETYHIGHIIAPRLNAAGRITHALDSLRLVCTTDKTRAYQLASQISETNRDRQSITQDSSVHADATIEVGNEKLIFVSHEEYDQGVIGLVASRLVEKHYRPSIVVAIGEEISKGSSRSIVGFNIIEFLRLHSEFFIDAGGHPMAAGFTIKTSRIEEFKLALIKSAKTSVTDEMLVRNLNIDLELSFSDISFELYNTFQSLAPFGMGNPEPVFVTKKVKVENAKLVGKNANHLKMSLSQSGKILDAILFRAEESNIKKGEELDFVYAISNDKWNGRDKLDLKIKDFKL